MPVNVQKVNHVAYHRGLFLAALLSPGREVVAPEASGLFHLRDGRVDNVGAVSVREGGGAVGPGAVLVLPFVDVVAGVSKCTNSRLWKNCRADSSSTVSNVAES